MPDNSAAVVNEQPEQALDYSTWLKSNDANPWMKGDQSFWSRFFRFFDGSNKLNEQNYQAYLNNLNIRNEQRATQSARAWDELMSSTNYSRAFKDLEAAGVNPYLLLNSGGIPSTSVGGSSKPDYSVSKATFKDSNQDKDFATLLITLAAIFLTRGRTGQSASNVGKHYPIASFR